MRAIRLARPLACVLGLASLAATVSALGQPPPRGAKHGPPAAATTKPGSAAATTYLSGRQPLLGWHAPAPRPVARDPSGRPMLTLTTINHGETLSLAADGDDGGFSSSDLDRPAH